MLVPLFGKYFLAALGVLHRFATEIKPSKLDLDNTSGRNEIMYKYFFILLLFQKTILASNVLTGVVVDIQNPDYELRYKIVKSKIDELKLNQLSTVNLSEEIQKFISSEIRTSIRELVVAINRIISFSKIYNKVPTLAETKAILKDLLNLSENKVTIDSIQTIVCQFFKISKNEMLSARRSRYLVRPRQTAIYLAKLLTSKSLPEIGRSFSNRDHTTVIHSVKTIEKLRKEDKELNSNIDNLKNKILYNKVNEV